ncbi:MAG: hypothetical protein AAGL11_08320 [Pseudomonadota bacterium]
MADLFGLNIRGAKTIGHLFARPKAVFESARVYDWQSQYTPTMRLAFSILTVFSLLSFFWTAEDGVLYQTLYNQFSEIYASDPNSGDLGELIDAMFAGYNIFFPFIYMLVHSVVGSIVFLWGKGTPWVSRIRLYFGIASVGIAISVASLMFMPFIDPSFFWLYSTIGMGLGFLAYTLTYARGMRSHYSIAGLIGRSFLLAFIVTLTDFIVALLAGTSASFWAERALA